MLKNYLLIAFRTLQRRKTYSIVNIIGLATGLACSIFIFNWVADELSFDQHFPKKQRIYRIVAEAGVDTDRWGQSVTSLPLGTTLQSELPEIEKSVRLDKNDAIVEREDKKFIEDNIVFTDPSFFNVFDYHLIKGNEGTALDKPFQVVLTESMAEKYFPEEDPIGKTLNIYLYDTTGTGVDYEVTGVIKDPPATSHFTFNMLGSLQTLDRVFPGEMDNWGNNSYHTYILVNESATTKELEPKIAQVVDAYAGEYYNKYNLYYRFYLQPVTSIHLHSDLLYEFKSNSNTSYIIIFTAVGILILVLAIINYVNLATSFSLERAREIGVRKVMGAQYTQLIRQHLIETLLITFISLILAGLFIEIFKPLFYMITGRYNIEFHRITLLLELLLICIPVGLLAGFFPARVLAKMNTIKSLKGNLSIGKGSNLRAVLVTSQFVITMIILIGLIVINTQLDFVLSKDLGYKKDNLLVLRVNGNEDVRTGFPAFKESLLTSTEVSAVAYSNSMITHGLGNSNGKVDHENGETQYEKLYRLAVDYEFLDTYEIELAAGRGFNLEIASDSLDAFIVNKKAAEAYGWEPEEAIGKKLTYGGMEGYIIGVTDDFHYNSLKHDIQPLCMYLNPSFSRISIRGEDEEALLNVVSQAWAEHYPSAIFDYTFQDQALFMSYGEERRFSNIVNTFTIISILIAFLGLFGLVGYTVSKKTKEIGIRKVFGASVFNIISMITGNFVRLLFIAAVIAFPVSWWMMDSWLSKFSYHVEMNAWIFIAAGGFILFFSILIIMIRSLKASLTNPVQSLKEE